MATKAKAKEVIKKATKEERAIQVEMARIAQDAATAAARLRPALEALVPRIKALPGFAELENAPDDVRWGELCWRLHCYVECARGEGLGCSVVDLEDMAELLQNAAALTPADVARDAADARGVA